MPELNFCYQPVMADVSRYVPCQHSLRTAEIMSALQHTCGCVNKPMTAAAPCCGPCRVLQPKTNALFEHAV